MNDVVVSDLRVQAWNRAEGHEIGALAADGIDQVEWACSCGVWGDRTTALLAHIIANVESGENLSLVFDRARAAVTADE